jgi:hypothetical protein
MGTKWNVTHQLLAFADVVDLEDDSYARSEDTTLQ